MGRNDCVIREGIEDRGAVTAALYEKCCSEKRRHAALMPMPREAFGAALRERLEGLRPRWTM